MPKPQTKEVTARWQHRGQLFAGEGAGKAPVTVDGDNAAGPGPMETLLIALAACTGSDVVSILEKKRVQLKELRIDISGDRREDYPQRYTAIRIRYGVTAPGATEQAVRQAIDLSLEKYCSVSGSLNPDITVTYDLALQA